jgi:hypothetical protein
MKHQIEVPQWLINQWRNSPDGFSACMQQAAQWGADQQLDKCCEWLSNEWRAPSTADSVRIAMRPKPPSLKEQAAKELLDLRNEMKRHGLDVPTTPALARALESIPDADES